jgi:hypothetical protein
MPYQSATSDVREECRNILPEDISDTEIQEEQAAAYGFLSGVLGEYDANTPKIDAIKKLEIILAASFVMKPYNTQKADEKQSQFKALLEMLQSGMGAGGDVVFRHAVTTYGSYVAAHQEDPDTDVRYYKSTRTLALESQSRLIVQSSVPALESNDPGYIITNCRDMF